MSYQASRKGTPSRKRIVICCDGTWQSSVSGLDNVPSNVTRLARHLACDGTDTDGNVWDQIVYYDSGVGTGEIGAQTVIQGGSGTGLATNVIEAYNFIVLNYKDGDQIYCFGFSRGAYTARAVAGLVTDIGIIQPKDMQEFPALYKKYQANNKGDDFRKTIDYVNWVEGVMTPGQDPALVKSANLPESFAHVHPRDVARHPGQHIVSWDVRPHGEPVPDSRFVEVVGVFDTVGSLGVPDIRGIDLSYFRKSYGFHNVKLSPFIKKAYHALAIDEHRGPFTPTLWYIPYKSPISTKYSKSYLQEYTAAYKKAKSDAEKIAAFKTYMDARDTEILRPELDKKDLTTYRLDRQKLYQVWFPGMHINIGGGSDDLIKDRKGDLEQIAGITFCWMAEMLRPDLELDMSSKAIFEVERKDALDRAARKKNYGSHWMSSYLNHGLEVIGAKKIETYQIDEETKTGWATGDIQDSYGGVMTIAGSITRHPGQCHSEKPEQGEDRPLLTKLGKTWEYIHPCVAYRMLRLKDGPRAYHPEALEGYKRTPIEKDNGKIAWYQWIKPGGGAYKLNAEGKVVQSDIELYEWVIYPNKDGFTDESFERVAMTAGAKQFIGELDNIYRGATFWKQALGEEVPESKL